MKNECNNLFSLFVTLFTNYYLINLYNHKLSSVFENVEKMVKNILYNNLLVRAFILVVA